MLTIPSGAADSPHAEWVKALRDKVLFARGFEAETAGDGNASSDKSKAGGVNREMEFVAHWITQQFNTQFQPESSACEEAPSSSSSGAKRWSLKSAKQLLSTSIHKAVLAARRVCEPFDGSQGPITAALTRLEAAKLPTDRVGGIWSYSVRQARAIYSKLLPMNRLLAEQIEFSDNVHELLKSPERVSSAVTVVSLPQPAQPGSGSARIGSLPSVQSDLNAIVEVVALGRHLAQLSCEAEPDVVNKHTRSAEAVIKHASSKALTFDAAIADLNTLARPLLRGAIACEFPSRVGYHTIVDAVGINEFLTKQRLGDPAVVEQRTRFLTENAEVNDGWRGRRSDDSLLTIFGKVGQ